MMTERDEVRNVGRITQEMKWEYSFTDNNNFHIITEYGSRLQRVDYKDFLGRRIFYWSAWLTTQERINGTYEEVVNKFVDDYNKVAETDKLIGAKK